MTIRLTLGALLLATSVSSAKHPAKLVERCWLEPCALRGDFDGDGAEDVATLVENGAGKRGIEVRFASGRSARIGAGARIGNGGDELSWMDHWQLEPRDETKGKPRDRLRLERTEAGGGVVSWNGARFVWRQAGD